MHILSILAVMAFISGVAIHACDASSREQLRTQPPPSPPAVDDSASTHSWLLAVRLLDGASQDHLPLINTSLLVHARLQSCRPTVPASPLLLPPSLRSPPCASDGSCGSDSASYAQLECVHVWHENWALWSNNVGLAPIPLVAPAARFASPTRPEQRAQMGASTKRMQLRLMKQSPVFTPLDLIWMEMMDFDPSGKLTAEAQKRGEREFDPQGLAAVLVNGPGLPQFNPELETKQLLWPFNPAGQCGNTGAGAERRCDAEPSSDPTSPASDLILLPEPVHELDVVVWSRGKFKSELTPHPFLRPPSHVSVALSLLERLQNQVHSMMHHAWAVVWLLPLSIGVALGLLRLIPIIRKSSAMRTAARRCINFGKLVARAKRKSLDWLRDRVGDRARWVDNAMVMSYHASELIGFFKERAAEVEPGMVGSLRRRWDQTREAVVGQILSTGHLIRSRASQFALPTVPRHLSPGALLDRLFELGKAADAAAYRGVVQPIGEAARDRWQLWRHSAEEAAAAMKVNLSWLWIPLLDLPVVSFFDSLSRTVATAMLGALSPSPPAPFGWDSDVTEQTRAAEQEAQDEAEVAAERELFGRPEFELQHGQPVSADVREHFQDLLTERERMQQQKDIEHKAMKTEEGETTTGQLEHKQPEQPTPAPFGWQPLQMDVWSRAEKAYTAARPPMQITTKMDVEEEDESGEQQ